VSGNTLGQLLTSRSETARFTSERFTPEGTTKNLSQVCEILRRYVAPTFDSGYEDPRQGRGGKVIDTHILTLKSNSFKPGIDKLSFRLSLQFNPPGDVDVDIGVEPGVVTIEDSQSPIDDTLEESGMAFDPSAQSQQSEITVLNPPDYDEWLEKFGPLLIELQEE
jgi:hypothetical protein